MKTIAYTKHFALFISIALILFSCDTPDSVIPEPDLSVVEDEFKLSNAMEDLDNITLTALESSGLGFRTTSTLNLGNLCATANISHDTAAKKITVDFGSGCTGSNGTVRKGKINFTYTGSFLIPGSSVVTTFEGFEADGLKIEGTRTITNTGINLANFEVSLSVRVQNGKITWSDGGTSTFETNQVRKVTLTPTGYQASVTGTASGISRKGTAYTASISDPLIITQSCVESGNWAPNKGKIDFTYLGITVSVDYGFGDCDKEATLTYPGHSKVITLD